MKKALIIILGIVLFGTQSCDVIDSDDRKIKIGAVQANKTALLIEFTDQNCINCSAATQLVEDMKSAQMYGANLISVSMHAYPMQLPLVTTTGKLYNNVYTSDYMHPAAIVDGGSYSVYKEEWSTLVRNAIQKTAPVDIQLSCSYNEQTKEITVASNIRGIKATASDLKLELWITEDNIASWQLMPDGSKNSAYVHNNVFRASLTGDWGKPISVAPEETISDVTTYVLNSKWTPQNLHIVGFIYSGNEKFENILQAATVKVVK